MSDVNITINREKVVVPKNTTILEAAERLNIDIPSLCYHPDQSIKANCRLCMVEVKGSRRPMPACSTYVWEGMEVETNTKKIRDMRKSVLELIMANHNRSCATCARNGDCELQELCHRMNISETVLDDTPLFETMDANSPIVRDQSKCVKCGRCVEACQKTQEVYALTHSGRSSNFTMTTAYNMDLADTPCVFCGQCSAVCPTGAIVERDDTQRVWDAVNNPAKHVVVQIAPAVRVALGDVFGFPKGAIVTGKAVAALKLLGVDKVFDTNFTADLTIMEESAELIERIRQKSVLPMITSCSPGWINYVEGGYAHLLGHLSTCKSPQQMFGALSKSYYADIMGLKPEDIFTLSIMPCTAKKYECQRPEMKTNGVYDVDCVLTTRELARMIKSVGIEFAELKDENFDEPFGISSGGGAIFGNSGGVMEAALRTAHELLTGKPLDNIDLTAVRGLNGIKEATIDMGGLELRVAAVSGLANAKKLLEQIDDGTCPYHFIEVMACPGGCIGGGGQPVNSDMQVKAKRADAIYDVDRGAPIREPHKNPEIIAIYDKYLGKPLGQKSHELLHTNYAARPKTIDYSRL